MTTVQIAVEFGQRSGNEPVMEVFLDNGDPQVKAGCEELPLPKRPIRTAAVGKSARIAIKAKRNILFIDAADVIVVEAKGKYVLLLHTQVRTCCESLSRPWRKSSICTGLCAFIDLCW